MEVEREQIQPSDAIVLVGGNVVAPEGVVRNGWLSVKDGTIDALGRDQPADGIPHDIRTVGGKWIVPGFVDLHCHGGGGGSFLNGDPDSIRTAADFHRRHGTTTLVASLVSSPHEHLMRSTRALRNHLRTSETIVGIHLEGPFLSRAHCGAHDPRQLRPPSPQELGELTEAADGHLRQVTIAPELPGAMELIDQLVASGIVAAIGHTAATPEQTREAIGRGARLATHLCNAMPVMHHRAGGPAIALMNDDRVFVELIHDGVHLDPEVVQHIVKSVGSHRICMITDAIEAAGLPNGRYKLAGLDIDVADGTVRLATPEAPLAGSALTMAKAFANTAKLTRSLVQAARMCSTTPAQVLGLTDRGALVRGRFADLVVLSDSLDVVEVWQRGERVVGRDPSRGQGRDAG